MATKGTTIFRCNGEDLTINDPNNADEFSASINYSAGQHVTYQGDLWRFRRHHSAGAWNAAHADKIRDGANTKTMVQGINEVIHPSDPWAYLYGFGFFNGNLEFDASNQEVATLRIPLETPAFVILSCGSDFMTGITTTYLFTFEMNDGTLNRTNASNNFYRKASGKTDGNYEAVVRSFPNLRAAYITINCDKMDGVRVIMDSAVRNTPKDRKAPSGIIPLSIKNTASCQSFMNESYISMISDVTVAATLWKTVNEGDQITDMKKVIGINYMGTYHSYDDTVHTNINAPTFICPKDGFVCLFDYVNNPIGMKYVPASRIRLYAEDVMGLDPELSNPYSGLNAVAFGTSLTYRSQSTGGYLNYLPTLSGMTIDNQGIGSSTIKRTSSDATWILYAIRHYEGFANKDVCILEGFVNDFGYNPSSLGTYKDDTEDTVCGCVRTAITYIMDQNPNLTFFLILDHYGKYYNGVDSRSTAVNSNDQTQFEWWEEIAKVAESLGVHVIKLYAMSGIGEIAPQYLMDNIHPNALGALQSANAIWSEMKKYYPNVKE